jgi:hypothetical protein
MPLICVTSPIFNLPICRINGFNMISGFAESDPPITPTEHVWVLGGLDHGFERDHWRLSAETIPQFTFPYLLDELWRFVLGSDETIRLGWRVLDLIGRSIFGPLLCEWNSQKWWMKEFAPANATERHFRMIRSEGTFYRACLQWRRLDVRPLVWRDSEE